MVSAAAEDYLKAIYRLQETGSPASTNAIAELLGVRAASVTSMLQQLSERGLAAYTPYRGAYLSEEGLYTALRVIRRHRLIELYLTQYLDVPWDKVHAEAERLEHAISPYLEERIAAKLGHPQFDPHGAPIPSDTGAIPLQDLVSLIDLPPGVYSVVRRVPDNDPDLLRYVASLGLMPDARVVVTGREPFAGPVSFSVLPEIDSDERPPVSVVSAELARAIFVDRPGAPAS